MFCIIISSSILGSVLSFHSSYGCPRRQRVLRHFVFVVLLLPLSTELFDLLTIVFVLVPVVLFPMISSPKTLLQMGATRMLVLYCHQFLPTRRAVPSMSATPKIILEATPVTESMLLLL